jgi:hypothetical protein
MHSCIWGWPFWGAKALLSAVELGLLTTLAHGPLTGVAPGGRD